MNVKMKSLERNAQTGRDGEAGRDSVQGDIFDGQEDEIIKEEFESDDIIKRKKKRTKDEFERLGEFR